VKCLLCYKSCSGVSVNEITDKLSNFILDAADRCNLDNRNCFKPEHVKNHVHKEWFDNDSKVTRTNYHHDKKILQKNKFFSLR
jgi:succinate dehydrogenase/fumarate reductase-like Fe-S protein